GEVLDLDAWPWVGTGVVLPDRKVRAGAGDLQRLDLRDAELIRRRLQRALLGGQARRHDDEAEHGQSNVGAHGVLQRNCPDVEADLQVDLNGPLVYFAKRP